VEALQYRAKSLLLFWPLFFAMAWVASMDEIPRRTVRAECLAWLVANPNSPFERAKSKTTGLEPLESLTSPYENTPLLTLTSNWHKLL
jgi:hypothetical protein